MSYMHLLSSGLGEDAFTKNTLFDTDLDPKVKVARNVVQYPLNHVTYAPAKLSLNIFYLINLLHVYKQEHTY